MDLQRETAFLESYFRDYFAYLHHFFYPADDEQQNEGVLDPDSKLATFGVISLVFGIILQRSFISGLAYKDIDFPHAIAVEACFWFTVTIAVHFAGRLLLGRAIKFADSLSAILRIFPPAFLVAAYGGFLGASLGHLVRHPNPGMVGALVDMCLQAVLLLAYLPRSLTRSFGNCPRRAWVITLFLVFGIVTTDFCVTFQPHDAVAASKKSAPQPQGNNKGV